MVAAHDPARLAALATARLARMSTYAVDVASRTQRRAVGARSRDTLPAMLLFVVSALVVFHFALPADASDRAEIGLFWIALIFTALLGLLAPSPPARAELARRARAGPGRPQRDLGGEGDLGRRLPGTRRGSCAPAYALFFQPVGWELVAAVALADVGIASIGALLAAMAAASRSRELLLPLLFLLAIPAVIGGAAPWPRIPLPSSVSSPCTTLFLRSLRGPALSMSSLNGLLSSPSALRLCSWAALPSRSSGRPRTSTRGSARRSSTSTCRSP